MQIEYNITNPWYQIDETMLSKTIPFGTAK